MPRADDTGGTHGGVSSDRTVVNLDARVTPTSGERSVESAQDAGTDAYDAIVRSIRYLLIDEFAEELQEPDPHDPVLGYRIEQRVLERLGEGDATPLSSRQRQAIVDDLIDDLLGFGPLQSLLDDPTVTEVMVNGPGLVFAERSGVYVTGSRRFDDIAHIEFVIGRLLKVTGQGDRDHGPLVEAHMPNGSRVNIVFPPLAVEGPVLTIHKFTHDSYSAEDLISFGTLDEGLASFLRECVRGRLNILVSGAAGSGRTTLLNVLGSWIPEDERVVTIENLAELNLRQPQVVRLESSQPGIAGAPEVVSRDLVRTALRMHADRIVVGEVAGDEAADMLLAMGSGYDGWLATIHAESPADALTRFEELSLLALGAQASTDAIRSRVASAFDLVVHVDRLRDGTRRVMHVAEVGDPIGDEIGTRDVFMFDVSGHLDSTGRLRGRITATGFIPVFADRLSDFGGTEA